MKNQFKTKFDSLINSSVFQRKLTVKCLSYYNIKDIKFLLKSYEISDYDTLADYIIQVMGDCVVMPNNLNLLEEYGYNFDKLEQIFGSTAGVLHWEVFDQDFIKELCLRIFTENIEVRNLILLSTKI